MVEGHILPTPSERRTGHDEELDASNEDEDDDSPDGQSMSSARDHELVVGVGRSGLCEKDMVRNERKAREEEKEGKYVGRLYWDLMPKSQAQGEKRRSTTYDVVLPGEKRRADGVTPPRRPTRGRLIGLL